MIGIGVIGYGYWGPNLVRNYNDIPDAEVVIVSDLRSERLAQIQSHYPSVRVTKDFRDLLNDPAVDAIAIATPVSTHFDLAMQVLQAGKHVFVEKPMTTSTDQASLLIEEAERRNLVLMVDHTFIYTGAVRKIHELITSDELGDLYYYDSVRVNLGLFQHDVNVIWDLAVHDLSILDYILTEKPRAVSATGISHVEGKPENIAYLTLFFESNMIAHIHVNWLAPVKVRRTLIGGGQKMIVYNDLDPSEKIKIYDKGITVNNDTDSIYKALIDYRIGDMWAPRLESLEALQFELSHFIECIEANKCPITDGHAGLRVVSILEAATQSMAAQGHPVELDLRNMTV